VTLVEQFPHRLYGFILSDEAVTQLPEEDCVLMHPPTVEVFDDDRCFLHDQFH